MRSNVQYCVRVRHVCSIVWRYAAVRALGCTRALGDGRGGRGELGELPPRRRADPLSGFCQGRRLLRARPPAPCSWVHVHPGAHSVTGIGARGEPEQLCRR